MGQGGGVTIWTQLTAFIPLIIIILALILAGLIVYKRAVKSARKSLISTLVSICNTCGTTHLKNEKFCGKCGTPLTHIPDA